MIIVTNYSLTYIKIGHNFIPYPILFAKYSRIGQNGHILSRKGGKEGFKRLT